MIKAEREETTCLLDVAGKGSVKTSAQVPVKGIKSMSPVQEPVRKDVKGKRSCLLDGGKGIVHVKERDDSWGWKKILVDGIVRGRLTTPNGILVVLRG